MLLLFDDGPSHDFAETESPTNKFDTLYLPHHLGLRKAPQK